MKEQFFSEYCQSVQGYTLALIRNPGTREVLAVQKMRPAWQKGRFNFPGGKIEKAETPLACVKREVQEETGLDISLEHFKPVAVLRRPGQFNMYVFSTEYLYLENARSGTDEPLVVLTEESIKGLSDKEALENLAWLYGLAFDGYPKVAVVDYD